MRCSRSPYERAWHISEAREGSGKLRSIIDRAENPVSTFSDRSDIRRIRHHRRREIVPLELGDQQLGEVCAGRIGANRGVASSLASEQIDYFADRFRFQSRE